MRLDQEGDAQDDDDDAVGGAAVAGARTASAASMASERALGRILTATNQG
jgi:hypothetical protein